MSENSIEVTNNKAAHRYEVQQGSEVAVLTYIRRGSMINFLHTGVPHALEGRGIANKLAHTALEEAKAENLSVIPSCPFVASYIRRHREYLTLVPEEEREYLLEE